MQLKIKKKLIKFKNTTNKKVSNYFIFSQYIQRHNDGSTFKVVYTYFIEIQVSILNSKFFFLKNILFYSK